MTLQCSRSKWFEVLSQASVEGLEAAWREIADKRPFRSLRAPETGLTMVRARADGTGRPFNLGEATVTRCVVTAKDSENRAAITGVGYVLGRDRRQAELVACLDALFQDSQMSDDTRDRILGPLRQEQQAALSVAAQKTESTRVDFFTLVRGE